MLSATVAAINNREHPASLDHSKQFQGISSDSRLGHRNVLGAAITLVWNGSFEDLGIIATNPSLLWPPQSEHDMDTRTGAVSLNQQPFYHLWVVQQGSQQDEYPVTDEHLCIDNKGDYGTSYKSNPGCKDMYLKEKDCLTIKAGKSHLQSESVKLSWWESLFTIP